LYFLFSLFLYFRYRLLFLSLWLLDVYLTLWRRYMCNTFPVLDVFFGTFLGDRIMLLKFSFCLSPSLSLPADFVVRNLVVGLSRMSGDAWPVRKVHPLQVSHNSRHDNSPLQR
jgi:hypothetical protein